MLCLAVAAGKYTPEQLDEMSTSMKAAAEKFQSQVVSLGKEITPLAAKIPLIPAEIAQAQGQEDAEAKVLAVLEKEKALMVKICKLYDSMENLTNDINSEFTKAGSVAKEVQDQMTGMAKDTNPTNPDGQKLQFYLDKIQSTIMALDRANSGGRSYLSPVATGICKAETQEELLHVGVPASRLFLALKPPTLPKFFHLPSVLVGAVFGAIVVGAAMLSLVRAKKTSLMESLEWLPRPNRNTTARFYNTTARFLRPYKVAQKKADRSRGHDVQSTFIMWVAMICIVHLYFHSFYHFLPFSPMILDWDSVHSGDGTHGSWKICSQCDARRMQARGMEWGLIVYFGMLIYSSFLGSHAAWNCNPMNLCPLDCGTVVSRLIRQPIWQSAEM